MDPVQLRNWAGNVTFSTERLHRPRTVEQLQDLVAAADHIRALGTGHSFNRIADTTGDLVSVVDLEGSVDIDEAAGTVTVPAGARYGEVSVALQRAGLALHNLGSLPHISVAGACATGTHGSGVTNRCLAAAAVAVEFVQADGELVRVDRTDPAFGGSVLALGALGIATRMTLSVEPTYDLRQDVYLDAPLTTVLDNLDEILSSGYSVSLFSDAPRRDVIDQIWVKSRGADAPDASRWGARPADTEQHPITGQDPSAATQQLGVPGPWHARLPHFRLEFTPSNGDEQQSEFLVPREYGARAIRAVHELDLTGVLQLAEFRTIAADDLWLSPFHDRDTVAVHYTWIDDDAAVHDAVTAVERAIADCEPRPHWGKVFVTEPEAVRAQYPRLADFRGLADRHDPDRKFGNEFLARFVY
jgi:xylitol oxidase